MHPRLARSTSTELGIEELERSSRLSPATYARLLKQCIARKALDHGEQVHAHIVAAKDSNAAATSPYLGNLLLQLYARCGRFDRARSIFDALHHRNLFSWTTLIGGYVQSGHFDRALDLFHSMEKEGDRSVQPDAFVYTIALAACSGLGDLTNGRIIHRRCLERSIQDVVVDTAIINMYAKCGDVAEAEKAFSSMKERDSISWNAMIAAYAKNGHLLQAIKLYLYMTMEGFDPSEATFVSVLGACNSISLVRSIHLRFLATGIRSSDVITCLIAAFARCGSLDEARRVFECSRASSSPRVTIYAWTAMIAAYAHRGRCTEALKLFQTLLDAGDKHLEPDGYTYSIALMACASIPNLDQGRAIHARIIARKRPIESSVIGSLVSMYCKCGSLYEAELVFARASDEEKRSITVWNAMLSGYVQNDRSRQAMELYETLLERWPTMELTAFTLSILLGACAGLESLQLGREIHAKIVDRGMESDTVLLNSLVRMYSKCGSSIDAMEVFRKAHSGGALDEITWNAIIVAFARNGGGRISVGFFHEMLLHGFDPNAITLTAVLTACGHAGLIESFHSYFLLLVGDCGVLPSAEHYECMGDLLGRSGRIKDAKEMLVTMPFVPNAAPWRSLLGACRVHSGGVEIAGAAAEEVTAIRPCDHTAYVMLSNVYTNNYEVDEEEKDQEQERPR